MRSSGRAALGALRGLRNGAPFAMPKRAMSNVQKPLNGSRKGFRGRDAIVFESRSAYASTSRGPPRALTPRGTWHCRRRGALRLGRKGSADLGSRFVEDPSTRTRAAFGQTRTRAPPWFLAGPGPDPDPGQRFKLGGARLQLDRDRGARCSVGSSPVDLVRPAAGLLAASPGRGPPKPCASGGHFREVAPPSRGSESFSSRPTQRLSSRHAPPPARGPREDHRSFQGA
mmetsp:Transcript_6702/g.23681  ORF Transcript_6702/g.23681 Transcript_6702/m.23681 type:complete len:228 (+) Transcript_6702:651-1334(+)